MSPIHEFLCRNCGRSREELTTDILDSPEWLICKCGDLMTRQISSSSFRLEGGGWEKDGYTKPFSWKDGDK